NKGMITGGFSTNQAGAIYVSSGQLTITGGNITGNRGLYGAVWINSTATNAKLTLGGTNGGKGNIYNNTMYNDENIVRDVHFAYADGVVNVASQLTNTQKMSLWRATRGDITSSYGKYNTTSPKNKFYSAYSPQYEVEVTGSGTTLEADYFCYDNALNWSYFVQLSASTGKQQEMRLYGDWKAPANSSYGTAFGTDGTFYQGALYAYSGANVVLDLHGYDIDRGLKEGRDYGYIIRVNGKLTIIDSTSGEKGVITGGYNNRTDYQGAGGVMVYAGGEFTMTSGSLTGNHGAYVGGVNVYSSGKLNIGGDVKIYDNFLGTTTTASNIRLDNTATGKIGVVGELTGGKTFGVTRLGNGIITNGFGQFHPDADATKFFVSENANYNVISEGSGSTREAAKLSYVAGTNWDYAIQTSISTRQPVVCPLFSDWTGVQNSTNPGFGTTSNCYSNGALYVPSGANVILELNGHTVNRNFTSANNYGYVIYIYGGTLTIRDSSAEKTGKITGGYTNNGTAAGVYIYTGTLNLEGGAITGNRNTNGSGTAGVGIYNSSSTFRMSGGSIDHNIATSGYAGGVYIYNSNSSIFEMTGGVITENSTVNASYTGGVYVNATSVFRLGGSAQIFDNKNTATVYGHQDVFNADNTSKVSIVSNIESNFKVGISRTTNNYETGLTSGRVFTTGWYTYANGASPEGKFFSDDAMYRVQSTGGLGQREAAMWCIDGAKNWDEACAASNSDGKQRTVTLYKDWEATYHGSYTTAFMSPLNGSYFTSGALYMNGSQMNILLDLNGYKLDRKLTAARSNGYVIYINGTGNKLEITDSSDDNSGMITGGFSTNQAGAIYVASGQLTISGGNITGNRGLYGAIWINNTAPTATLTLGSTRGAAANIYNNTMYNDENNVRDIHFTYGTETVKIAAKLTSTEQTSIYRTARGPITKDYGKYNSADPKTYFYSAYSPEYEVESVGTGASLEADYFCYDNMLNWSYFVQLSASTGKQQEMRLYSDWTAAANSSYGTAFGTDGTFYQGALYAYSGANVVLDLHGYDIDRGLTSARDYGYIIRVNGKLTIVDNSAGEQGTIKGGYNNRTDYQGAGGVVVYAGGELTMTSGTLTGNHGAYVGGINVYSSGKFNIGGSTQIYDNFLGTSTTPSNIRLDNTATGQIGVVEKLTGGKIFGVTRLGNGIITNGFGQFHPDGDVTKFFVSENANYNIINEGSGTSREASKLSYVSSTNWEYAVLTSLANRGTPVVCQLFSDWTGAQNSTSPGFGTTSNCYTSGALYVPTGAHVILELNG
ncbi:MAG: hypothetical protein K2L87_05435, partial [Clostridiales bacterium]|nr:hypothetical protein [Clostridiales bacterium]